MRDQLKGRQETECMLISGKKDNTDRRPTCSRPWMHHLLLGKGRKTQTTKRTNKNNNCSKLADGKHLPSHCTGLSASVLLALDSY